MNENIKTQNKEIIAPAMKKCKKIGKSIIIPNIDFSNTEINSSNIKDNKKIISEKVVLLELENEKLKKKVEQLEEKIEELQEEIELDEKYYGYN